MLFNHRAHYGVVFALIGLAALTVAIGPMIYDNAHFADTIFIMGASWRQFSGLEAALDFGHFYGGVTVTVIEFAMQIFGPSVKTLDYALIMFFGAAGLCLGVVSWQRTSRVSFVIGLVFMAVLMFTRHPLEMDQSVTRLISTHSFIYNRLGLAIFWVVGLYVLLATPNRLLEMIAGLLVGALLVIVALTKPTFVVLIPAVVLALLVQMRGIALAAVVLGFLGGVVLLDPWAARWFASFDYVMGSFSGRDDSTIKGLIVKAIQLPLSQPIALAMALGGGGIVLAHHREQWRPLVAAVIYCAAGVGMATTMGIGGIFGQLMVPICALFLVICLQLTSEAPMVIVRTMAIVLTAALAFPHGLNLAGTTAEAFAARDQRLITDGPMARYISLPGAGAGQATQYEMLADGVEALQELGDMREKGIIADNGISFEYALAARPVPAFPLWQNGTSWQELSGDRPLPPEVDLVLLGHGRQTDQLMGPVLRSKLGSDFALCRRSRHWDIYARGVDMLNSCAN